MTIYTGGGDKGNTSLLSGERLSKADPMVEAYGTLDELTAQLGVCRAQLAGDPVLSTLGKSILSVQQELFRAGMQLSSKKNHWDKLSAPLTPEDIFALERAIDGLEAVFGLPFFFVSPGKTLAGASLHLARTICRRAERRTLAATDGVPGYETIQTYLNRLSDFLFVLSWAAETRILIKEELTHGNHL